MLVTKRELEYCYPEHIDIDHEQQKRIVEERKKRRKRARSAQKLLGIGFAVVGTILSLLILIGYLNITRINHEIAQLEEQKMELNREKEDLIAELEAIKSPAKLEEDALNKLGMDYPTEEQVVYLDVEELNFAEDGDYGDMGDQHLIVQRFKEVFNLLLGLF
ncbi:MAG TPA: hypothetical protein GXX70_04825 [Tepidimicrobium sp.]|nr:hypothetical protein [Tepidimicrobium sp.]